MGRRGAWRGGPPNGNGGGQQNQNSRNNSLTISGPPGGSKTSIHDQSVRSSLLIAHTDDQYGRARHGR